MSESHLGACPRASPLASAGLSGSGQREGEREWERVALHENCHGFSFVPSLSSEMFSHFENYLESETETRGYSYSIHFFKRALLVSYIRFFSCPEQLNR